MHDIDLIVNTSFMHDAYIFLSLLSKYPCSCETNDYTNHFILINPLIFTIDFKLALRSASIQSTARECFTWMYVKKLWKKRSVATSVTSRL